MSSNFKWYVRLTGKTWRSVGNFYCPDLEHITVLHKVNMCSSNLIKWKSEIYLRQLSIAIILEEDWEIFSSKTICERVLSLEWKNSGMWNECFYYYF